MAVRGSRKTCKHALTVLATIIISEGKKSRSPDPDHYDRIQGNISSIATIHTDYSYSSSSPPYSQPPHYGVDTQAYSPHGSIPSMQHRLSNKERPMSPELSSAFPEHVRAAEGDKEVVAYQQPQPLPYQRPADGSGGDGRRILGMRSKWFYGLLVPLVVLVVLGIGLGVGLGVGLGNQKSQYVTPHSSGNVLCY
jgi:hypothetical protein